MNIFSDEKFYRSPDLMSHSRDYTREYFMYVKFAKKSKCLPATVAIITTTKNVTSFFSNFLHRIS